MGNSIGMTCVPPWKARGIVLSGSRARNSAASNSAEFGAEGNLLACERDTSIGFVDANGKTGARRSGDGQSKGTQRALRIKRHFVASLVNAAKSRETSAKTTGMALARMVGFVIILSWAEIVVRERVKWEMSADERTYGAGRRRSPRRNESRFGVHL